MAVLDAERNMVVIRIVYDGPPEAGKTTSLRALSASLARPMITPSESGGRTLFFDWLEYTGGLFEGHQIRCQIVTVPGQAVLAHRRHGLLESADVVVFVSDSSPSAIETTRTYLGEMRATLDRQPAPRVGVILQANKRDLPDAVDLDVIRRVATDEGIAVLPSVATEGSGVRETFVFAVRLALDRVREMLRLRSLDIAPPAIEDSDALLRQLARFETERMGAVSHDDASAALSGFREVVAEEKAFASIPIAMDRSTAQEPDIPLPPDDRVPAGMIWPPVDGRVFLHEACATPFVPHRSPQGDWFGETNGWRFHSPREAAYTDAELGRRALVEWARLHASGQRWFSGPRVVALAASGTGVWRLWQMVKIEDSLRDLLVSGIPDSSSNALLRRLLDAGRMLLSATESLALAPCRLPLTIDTVGMTNGTPQYIGYLPDPFLVRAPQPISAENRATLLRRELGALASAELRAYGRETFPALRSIVRENDPRMVIDALRDVLVDSGLVTESA